MAAAGKRKIKTMLMQLVDACRRAPRATLEATRSKFSRDNLRLSTYLKWFMITFLVLATAVALWLWREPVQQFLETLSDQEAVSAKLQAFGLLGPIFLAFIQLLQVLIAFIPGHIFLIAAGYVYGFPLGLLFNITFTVIASQIAFLLARWAGRPIVNRLVAPDVIDHWERVANQKGVFFFTLSFLLPVFPSDAMNFVAGLSGISPRRFLLASFMGRLPSAIMLTLIGSHGLEMSTTTWVMIVISLAVLFLVGRYVMMKIHQQAAVAPLTAVSAAD